MRRLAILATVLQFGFVGGCAFSPEAVPPSRSPDAPLADGPSRADASFDAQADAPIGVDAEPDPCLGGSTTLQVGVPRRASIAGASLYDPVCAGDDPTGGEDVYRVDVGAASSADLVIDVEEHAAVDTLIDVTPSCTGAGQCEDHGAAGGGEVLVIPFVSAGRRYVAVDSLEGQGAYTVRAFLRGIVGENATCSPDLESSRCLTGLHCLERDGETRCRPAPATADTGGNGNPCATPTLFAGDAVYSGDVGGPTDVDVVAIEVMAPRTLRLVVHDGGGGCTTDLVAEVLTGASCDDVAIVATDDNSGLGSCPRLDAVALPTGRSWVRIKPATGAKLAGEDTYELELDVF